MQTVYKQSSALKRRLLMNYYTRRFSRGEIAFRCGTMNWELWRRASILKLYNSEMMQFPWKETLPKNVSICGSVTS